MDEKFNEVVTFLEEEGIATRAEIILVTNINGCNMDALNDIIYVRTGDRDYESLLEECGEYFEG